MTLLCTSDPGHQSTASRVEPEFRRSSFSEMGDRQILVFIGLYIANLH